MNGNEKDAEESVGSKQWMDVICKPPPVTLDDLAKDKAPVMASNPTTYALLISDIDPWPIPTTLKRKLQEVQLQDGIKERNIACSISMSFYHVRSKRFFGSTFVGYEHVFSITDSTNVSFPARNLNEMMYFQSKIQDRNCFAVLELVMTTYDSFNGSVASRYGCGWALLKPFLPTYGTKGNSQLDGIISTGKTNVYAGTPKDLLSMKGDGAAVLKQLTNKKVDQPVSTVSYKIWRQDALNEIITSSNIIKENQIVGALTIIAGLDTTTVNCFDSRGSIHQNCIGASTVGNILSWSLVPHGQVSLAPTFPLKISNIAVEIPQRLEFEQALLSFASNNARPKNRFQAFAWNKLTDKKDSNRASTQILHRRLKVGVHNGYNLLQNQWRIIDLEEGRISDLLTSSNELDIQGFIKHPNCAIVFLVEYEFETDDSPKKLSSNVTTVVLGSTLCPLLYDALLGMKCSTDDEFAATLPVRSDSRCLSFTDKPIFSQNKNAPLLNFLISSSNGLIAKEDGVESNQNSENGKPLALDDSSHSQFLDVATQGTLSEHHKNKEEKDDSSSQFSSSNNVHIKGSSSFRDTSTLTFGDSTAIEDAKDSHINEVIFVQSHTSATKTECVDYDPSAALQNSGPNISASKETEDMNTITSISLTCTSYKTTGDPRRSLSFRLKFHSMEEIVTDSFPLRKVANEAVLMFSNNQLPFGYDYSTMDAAETTDFINYLLERHLFVDLFEEELHVGTIALPMYLFLRQGKETQLLENMKVDVVGPREIGNDTHRLHIVEGKLVGPIIAQLTLSIKCEGSRGERVPQYTATRSHALNLLDTSPELLRIIADLHECYGDTKTDSYVSDVRNGDQPETQSLRRQQLKAVQALQRQHQKKSDRKNDIDSLGSFFRDITSSQGLFDVDLRVLQAVQWYREGKKKSNIMKHIEKQKQKDDIIIRPWLGQRILIEYEFTNPISADSTSPDHETFRIEGHPAIHLISNSAEWASRRKAAGASVLAGKENLLKFESMEDDRIKLHPHETVVLPLAFDCTTLEQTRFAISFVTVDKNIVCTSFNINVYPRLRTDRRLLIPCDENENIRRSIIFQPKNVQNEDQLKIKCIDETSTRGVACEWAKKETNQGNAANEIRFDFQCPGRSPSIETCYILISNDNFNSILECWHVEIKATGGQTETVNCAK